MNIQIKMKALQDLPDTHILQPDGIPFYSLTLGDLRDVTLQLSLSVKREKIYRKALEEILFFSKSADRAYNYLKIQYTVQTALNEGKEVK